MADVLGLTEEQRLQLLVTSVTDYAIYMIDPDGRIATWNAGAERFKGYTASEIVGQHFSRFFLPEDIEADAPARSLRIAARDGRYEAEGWRVRKDGSRFWANVVIDPIRADTGDLLGFAKITRDITAKREREQELFDSEQRFRILVQGVRDYAIYMLDPDGVVTNWNAGAEAIKGYRADEVVGQHFSRFYTDQDRARGVPAQALETALREGKYETEAQRVRKDGSLFWAHVVIDPIFDDAGEHIGFAKVTRDVTERKLAETELETAREALAQAQKLQTLGELTGSVAHDFNNMMTVVAGASDFLLKHPMLPPEKQRQYLEAISDTAGRATSLTNQLLTFARRQSLRPKVIDVNIRLDAFAEMLARTLGSKIELVVDLKARSPLAEVDVTQLETALLNAAINARDAMPRGGQLAISTANCEMDGVQAICIGLTDTGGGIPSEKLGRVFEPFFTTKEVGKGTGLGLSQIHGFAAQAGGRAEIDSEEGVGTTLRMILPRTDKPVAPPEHERPILPLRPGLRILLVEDNPQVSDFAMQLLSDLDCEVRAAANAEEALEQLAKEPFDLVFSDVVMPGTSGIELAETIAGKWPDLPVLLTTGYSEQLTGNRTGRLIVSKPYDATSLSEAISMLIESARETAAPQQ